MSQTFDIAHITVQGVNCLVVAADATSKTDNARAQLLAQLTQCARSADLKVEKAALAFEEYGDIKYYGTWDLVEWLANNWLPSWNRTLTCP
jgi:hypothetical protein